jgi:hypothetical protein
MKQSQQSKHPKYDNNQTQVSTQQQEMKKTQENIKLIEARTLRNPEKPKCLNHNWQTPVAQNITKPTIYFLYFFLLSLSLSPYLSLRQSPSSQSFMAALTSATMFRSQKRELVTRGSRSGFCCWGRKFRGTPPCSGLSTSRRKCRQRLSTFGVPTGAGGDVF